jgi:hypothetical protein
MIIRRILGVLGCGPTPNADAVEQYGTAHGIPSVVAESAVLWLHAGDPDRATLLHRLAGPGLNTIAEDVDYLLTLSCLVDVAAGTGETTSPATAPCCSSRTRAGASSTPARSPSTASLTTTCTGTASGRPRRGL